ncbi:L,D-transpeptidase [Desulfuromonas versatilis]|uniref:L,D-transpeptidase n=1 Tax=Desulfuromonas versatilis TaxID=2802975 RepID=A0ABN6DZN5_9BACT|nr:L,D-transpeptidase family protein [Desulfuromonas versatilis]BCR05568.1 L,D-transpeptidase [Desulfuromonas versatilis]
MRPLGLAISIIIFTLLLLPGNGLAWHPRLEADSIIDGRGPAPIVGENLPYVVGQGETLIELARRAGVGYGAMVRANPGVDPWLPPPGKEIILPYAAILPLGSGPGITINLAEMRLYLVWDEAGSRRVRIYPIGIGREGRNTPEGLYKVISRAENPSWTPPPSIRKERPELPPVVPPGPDNPLGDFWIGLSAEGIGIHGTHKPLGIGRRVSSGCIRLYPEDIRDLFGRVKVGTPVRIIYQTVKLGVHDKGIFLEAHPDELGKSAGPLEEIAGQAQALGYDLRVDQQLLIDLVRQARGLPQMIAQIVGGQKTQPVEPPADKSVAALPAPLRDP